MDGFIAAHWQAMGEFDKSRHVKLVVDEWGAWHKPGTEAHPSHTLGQTSTLRDALLAGLTLDTFHRHADKVGMANIAQLVNCLQSLFVAHEDTFIVTPNYDVFEIRTIWARRRCGRSPAPRVSYQRNGQPATFWGLAGSAWRRGDKDVVDGGESQRNRREVHGDRVRGAKINSYAIRTLTAPALDAHNSFEQPNAVTAPPDMTPDWKGEPLVLTLPKASVSRAVSLPAWCCFALRSAPPPASALAERSARRRRRSSQMRKIIVALTLARLRPALLHTQARSPPLLPAKTGLPCSMGRTSAAGRKSARRSGPSKAASSTARPSRRNTATSRPTSCTATFRWA
jgi:hypothetical protein